MGAASTEMIADEVPSVTIRNPPCDDGVRPGRVGFRRAAFTPGTRRVRTPLARGTPGA